MKEAQVPPKHRFLQEPHGVTTQKTPFFIVTAVKTSNLTCILVAGAVPMSIRKLTVRRDTLHHALAVGRKSVIEERRKSQIRRDSQTLSVSNSRPASVQDDPTMMKFDREAIRTDIPTATGLPNWHLGAANAGMSEL
jgi:hypothetical protein